MRILLSRVLIVGGLTSTLGCEGAGRELPSDRQSVPKAASIAASDDSSRRPQQWMIGIGDIPDAALAVVRARWPGFAAFSPAKYRATDTAGARVSPDEGLVIVRGDFEGIGNEDLIVAGSDGSRGLLIALFIHPDGQVNAQLVSYLAKQGPAGAGTPSVMLARAVCEFSCANRAQHAVRVTTLDVAGNSVRNLYWDAKRREFNSDEPGGD
jgi:hypothetical protein